MTITTSLKSFARWAIFSSAYLALFLAAGTIPASAEQVIFTIDPSQSSLDFSTVDSTLGPLLPQYPGSLTTTVSGHFLLSFDPLSDTPATIQFLGTNNGYPNHGYFQDGSNNLGLPGAAPGLSMTTPEPANFAGTTVGGEDVLVYRNLVWDFSSPTISGASGSFPATTTSFYVRQGELDTLNGLNGVRKSYDQTGVIDALTTGSWTLSQSAPGSGNWTLTFNGTYTSSNYGGHPNSATFGGSMMATAHFGAANVTTVPQPAGAPVEVQVLGGAGAVGGVTIDLDQNTSGGALSVQQVPNNTALTPTQQTALQGNPLFLASTASLSTNPQIWDVQYAGNLNGGTATLVFHYDPALLPPGTDQSALGIWHFSTLRNQWEFGGTVNTSAHTIAYTTDGFSPFELGVAVPEPATAELAGAALIVGVGFVAWRRRR